MNPDQTAQREQSDMGPYCLQYMLSKNYRQTREADNKVLTGVLIFAPLLTYVQGSKQHEP